jgi:hypothetical protein
MEYFTGTIEEVKNYLKENTKYSDKKIDNLFKKIKNSKIINYDCLFYHKKLNKAIISKNGSSELQYILRVASDLTFIDDIKLSNWILDLKFKLIKKVCERKNILTIKKIINTSIKEAKKLHNEIKNIGNFYLIKSEFLYYSKFGIEVFKLGYFVNTFYILKFGDYKSIIIPNPNKLGYLPKNKICSFENNLLIEEAIYDLICMYLYDNQVEDKKTRKEIYKILSNNDISVENKLFMLKCLKK